MKKVFCHVLLFNSEKTQALRCVESVLAQEGANILCVVSDNGGSQEALHACAELPGCLIWNNAYNFGFCGGHNIAALRAKRWEADYFLVLNPDVVLTPGALRAMLEAFDKDVSIGLVTPKLLRSSADGHPVIPPMIDAAGMYLTKTFRHFDRGSEEIDKGQFDDGAYVFGGTGACLMLSMNAVHRLELYAGSLETDTEKVHPEMKFAPERLYLFDEAFFAYREDAELSFRAQCLGIKIWYEPHAVALHVRTQRGVKREHATINKLSVKNRFLLDAMYSSWDNICAKILTQFRNALVKLGVYIQEKTSIAALDEAKTLMRRAYARRQELGRRNPHGLRVSSRWFSKQYE